MKRKKAKCVGAVGSRYLNSALIRFLHEMSDNGLILCHIYVLFLWFLVLLCSTGADPENFLGRCKWDLHSNTIVLVRAEQE